MEKSLSYYLKKIEEAYPKIKPLANNFPRIAEEVRNEIAAGKTGKTAAQQLYYYTYEQLRKMAKFYADNKLDSASFEDAISELYLSIVQWINTLIDKNEIINITDAQYKNRLNVNTARCIKRFIRELDKTNQDAKIEDPKTSGWLEQVADVIASAQPEEVAEIDSLKEIMQNIINTLPPKEAQIVRIHYGLDGKGPKSVDQICKKYNVKRGVIFTIIENALRKMAHLTRYLAEYRDESARTKK